jgi:hypothetical protein
MTEDLVLSGVIKSYVARVKLYGRMVEFESVHENQWWFLVDL